jgi:hypothetical protein
MEKEFVPYQESFALKELGFDEDCFGVYLCRNSAFGIDNLLITMEHIDLLPYDSSSCKAPTYSQAFRFFREKYGLFYSVERESAQEYLCNYSIKEFDGIKNIDHRGNGYRYEEDAELACLRKLIEIVKNK